MTVEIRPGNESQSMQLRRDLSEIEAPVSKSRPNQTAAGQPGEPGHPRNGRSLVDGGRATAWRPRTWFPRSPQDDLSSSGEDSFDSDGQLGVQRRPSREVFGLLIDLGDHENEYRAHHLRDDAAQSAIAYSLWLGSSIALIYFDYVVLGLTEGFATLLTVRVFSSIAIVAALFAFSRVSNVRTYEWMTLGVSVAMASYVYAINSSRPPDYFANFVLDILFPLTMFLVIPNRLLFCTLSAAAFSIFDLVTLVVDRQGVPPMFRNVVIVSHVLANILGFLVAARVNSYRRRAYRLYRDEISSRRLIERIASEDDLTGSMTRRSFLSSLEHEMIRSRRFGRPLTVVLMDLDAFKLVNDGYGHHAGDELLRRFAATVTELKRDIDLFGRLGGEEFCLMLPETSIGGASIVAERIRRTWADLEVEFEGATLRSTVSMGVATLVDDDEDHQALLRRADVLLYRAKRGGRNLVVVDDEVKTGHEDEDDYATSEPSDSDEMTGASPRFSSS